MKRIVLRGSFRKLIDRAIQLSFLIQLIRIALTTGHDVRVTGMLYNRRLTRNQLEKRERDNK